MIFDHRTYTAKPNMLASFLKLYEDIGLPMQRHYLGEPFGFFQTHIGELSRTIHFWKYESVADREARRDRMEADPEWQAYRLKVIETDYLADMRNQIVRPVSFFTPQESTSPGGVFDHRTYTARPNMLASFLKLYEDIGLPMQRHYLGEPFGFFQTHIGELSRIVHLWRYESLADREERRDRMEADPKWQAYRLKVIETNYLADMRNQILKPVSFFNTGI